MYVPTLYAETQFGTPSESSADRSISCAVIPSPTTIRPLPASVGTYSLVPTTATSCGFEPAPVANCCGAPANAFGVSTVTLFAPKRFTT